MNPTELELFLYRHTESESWHLQHPGQLSHLYAKMKQEEFRGEVGYCFDFVNTLKKDMIGMIKETRFTVIPKHHHVDMELNYIYSGSCTFVINGREITLKKGDLCILDSDVWHSATSYKKEHDIVINIVFRRQFFDGVFLSRLSQQGVVASFLVDAVSRNRRHDKYLIFHTQNEPKIHSLIQFLLCEYFDRSSCYGELIKAYATALFLELVNVMHSQAERTISGNNEILVPVLQYLEKNYKTCTLTQLAEKFGYNPNYLSAQLKHITGCSFVELKNSQQFFEAAFLLANTECAISEIMEKIGCSNRTFFYRKFEQIYGMTPREYRVQARKLQE